MSLPETISLASALLLFAGAQGDARPPSLKEGLQACMRVQDVGDRLTCFETLARSSAADPGEPAAPPAQAAPKSPMTATELRAATRERRRKDETRGERSRGTYDAVVLRAWEYATGDYYIALTNGEIWKSEAHDKIRHVKDREAVQLSPGAVGGWFMEFKTIKRPAIRVRLVE